MTASANGRPLRALAALGLSITIAAAGSGCGGHGESHAKASGPAPPVPITVADLRRELVETTVPVEGTLMAWDQVTVGARRGGRVAKVHREMGDPIAPGEPLLELERTDADLAVNQARTRFLGELVKLGISEEQAINFVKKYGLSERLLRGGEIDALIDALPAIKQAKVAVVKARQNLARQQSLYDRNAGTVQDLQNTQNDLASSEAALDNAVLTARTVIATAMSSKVALDVALRDQAEMTIVAPRPTDPKGRTTSAPVVYGVTKRMAAEGQMLKDGEAVFELVLQDPIRLWANVPERYRPEIKVGQPVRLTAMSRPGDSFEGEVARINPAVDPVSRTFQVEAIVPNSDGRLVPGGFAKGAIVTRSDRASTVVPLDAVYRFAGVTKVFVVEGDAVRGVPVQTGRTKGDSIEVIATSGTLPESGQVVTSGQTQLADDTKVIVREPVDASKAQPAEAAATGAH